MESFVLLGLGVGPILVVGGIALLLFGTRLPSLMRNLGLGVSEFRQGLRDDGDDDEEELGSDGPAKTAPL